MPEDPTLVTAAKLAATLTPGDLDQTLHRITTAAVELLPEVQLASITIRHRDGSLETVAPTDEVLVAVDKVQYELQQGPCYLAAAEEPFVVSPNLAADERFPRYAKAAQDAGLRAQVGLRLFSDRGTHGALDLYSRRTGAFTDLGELGTLFAHQAAVAINYAREVSDLKAALETRTVIGEAVGIVMERYEMNVQRSFAFLARLSSHRNVKLRRIAEELVAQAEEGAGGSAS